MSFKFKEPHLSRINIAMAKYPEERKVSAVLALLDEAQRQNHDQGHYVSMEMAEEIARILETPVIRVIEVASFFSMINLNPVGNFHIQLCGTTPCMLRGAEDLKAAVSEKYGIASGETTEDKSFTLTEVECLGCCCNAPMVQINDDYYEDLTPDVLLEILDQLMAGEKPKIGSRKNRHSSEPEGGALTLQTGIAPQNSEKTTGLKGAAS